MTQAEWDKLIDAKPGDPELRAFYATWLQDEQDDFDLAEFQRWLIDKNKFPINKLANNDDGEKCWAWHSDINKTYQHLPDVLPTEICDHMPNVRWAYPTRAEAETVVFEAWKKMRGAT